MAATGALLFVYCCVLLLMNCSCVMKLSWPRMYEDFSENDIDKSYISYRNIFMAKFLGREVTWNEIAKGLFRVQNRAEKRRKMSTFCSHHSLRQYLFVMIILLSGDISLNPGPGPNFSQKFDDVLRTRGLKVLHQNIRGLVCHKASLEELLCRSDLKQAHVIGISETHSNKNIRDSEIEIDGFDLFRKDRAKGAGGGVAVYVHKSLTTHRRLDLEEDGIECIWTEVLLKNSKPILVGNLYRPPDSSDYLPEDFNDRFETMLSNVCCENKEALLLGDFNCDYSKANKNRPLKSTIASFGFHQQVTTPTRIDESSESMIDLVLTNMPHNISQTVVLESCLSDHHLIGAVRKLNNLRFSPRLITCRNYKNYEKESLNKDLRDAPWDQVFKSQDAEIAYNAFENILTKVFDKHAPITQKKVRGLHCPWRTPEILKLIKSRDYHLTKAKKSGNNNDWKLYREYRNKVNSCINKSKAAYNKNLIEENTKNPKQFWNLVKKLYPSKDTASGGVSALEVNGKLETTKQGIASLFCDYFTTCAEKLCSSLPSNFTWRNDVGLSQETPTFKFQSVSKERVRKHLAQLKSTKSPGHDNLPPRLLKDGANAIAKPLTHIINLSFKTSLVPNKLKIARVIPLYKSGNKALPGNYRPISVLPALSKILERVAYEQIADHLEKYNMLTSCQFGFRKRYNTELAVTLFTDNIRREMDHGKLTGAVFIDLQKAFDTVEHSIILKKLPYYGISSAELIWVKSYLKDRYQFVQCGNSRSSCQLVKYGVPQGSILGPLLFLIQINDLTKVVKECNIQMYADDTVIYVSHKNISVVEEALTTDMANIAKWLENNRLIINLKRGKTETMLFGTAKRLHSKSDLKIWMNEHLIHFVSGYKYLGVLLDPSLNMKEHLHKTLKSAAARIKLLKRMRQSLTSHAAESIYKAIVLPKILYCSTPILKISDTMDKKFENLQTRAIKIINRRPECDQECRFMSVSNQKKYKADLLMFKCLQGTTVENFASYGERISHNYGTRGNKATLRVPRVRTEAAKKSFWFQGPSCFNELPIEIRNLESIVVFKHRLKEHLQGL